MLVLLPRQIKFANEVQTQIIDKMQALHRALEDKRKRLQQQEDKFIAQLRLVQQNVKNQRADCIKQWQSLQEAEAARTAANDEVRQSSHSSPSAQ